MAAQGIFKPKGKYIAVRPLKLNSKKTINPGNDVSHLKPFLLRSFFARRQIGHKNTRWTELMLEKTDNAWFKPEIEKDETVATRRRGRPKGKSTTTKIKKDETVATKRRGRPKGKSTTAKIKKDETGSLKA